MTKQITSEFNAEVEAEVKMIQDVLHAAGLNCGVCETMTNTEYRTFLISRLKHVPGIIEDLRRENRELRGKIKDLEEEIRVDNEYISEMNGGN